MTDRTDQHTPGPWEVSHYTHLIVAPPLLVADCKPTGTIPPHTVELLEGRANAAHIVACVNALEGLDPAAVGELIEAATIVSHGFTTRDDMGRLIVALSELKEGK